MCICVWSKLYLVHDFYIRVAIINFTTNNHDDDDCDKEGKWQTLNIILAHSLTVICNIKTILISKTVFTVGWIKFTIFSHIMQTLDSYRM